MRTHNNAKHRQPIQVPAIAGLHAGRTVCSAFGLRPSGFGFPHARPHPLGLSPRLRIYLACLGYLLLTTGAVFASPSSALREYKAGNYDQALKEYERLLEKKADDPRLHFNAGAAAYRNRQFEEAAKQFNATLAAPDLKLQGLAYYNEGNALYHLGEQSPDPKQRTEAWEKALQNYQSTMKLNPQDADAKFNYEFVKKKLEELKQQPQQSQQDKQDKQDQKENQDQQQQQNQNQQQQDQQKRQDQQKQQDQQQQQQAQQDDKQDSSQQKQAEQEKKEQEQQQAAQQPDQQKQEQQQAQQSPAEQKDKSDEKEQEAAAQNLAQMTQQQAQQLLDAQKGEEQMLPIKPTKSVDRTRPLKDW